MATNVTYERQANSPARSAAGRVRNIKAMANEKLTDLAEQMVAYPEDTEALAKINVELQARGLSTITDRGGKVECPKCEQVTTIEEGQYLCDTCRFGEVG